MAVRKACGTGFADAGERAREVSVILRGNQPVQSQHCQRSVLAGLVARVGIRPAGRPERIDHAFDVEWSGLQETDLFRLDVAGLADAVAVNGFYISDAGGQTRPFLAIAKDHRTIAPIINLVNEFSS